MEIKLSAGDKINIPENCKATIEDNQIIIEEKQEEFKEGDILHSLNYDRIVIFSNYNKDDKSEFSSYFNNTNSLNSAWFTDCFRLAAEEEKQAFFDDLKAKGLRWNAEAKQMEWIRKRVVEGKEYFTINSHGYVEKLVDDYWTSAKLNFNSGNYYLPSERAQAEEDAKAIKAIFEKRLKVK